MFFSKEQIEQSVKRLDDLDPFFGITFLAFKKAQLPIGRIKRIDASATLNTFLRQYYKPIKDYSGFYIPFRKENRWNIEFLYVAYQVARIDAHFSDVLLTYLLIWAWQEHVKTAESIRRKPAQNLVLLIDEVEAHLHPFWQRTIIPALMSAVQEIIREVQVQVIVATHSPLVLASAEPLFDHDQDKLFHLYLEDGSVQLDEVPFVKRGRSDQWLMSDVFGLAQPRSLEAEKAIEEASQLQLEKDPPKARVQEVSDKLVRVLAPDDEFWPLWTYFAKQRYDIEYLEEKAPFLARELKRQELDNVHLPRWEEYRK